MHKVENASLDWQEDGRPFASQYQDVFFTRGDEIAESQHVFIRANQLLERWTSLANEARTFVIGELGFGCTLNFLNTWRAWQQFRRQCPQSPLRLHYVSLEKHPLRHSDLKRIYQLWPDLEDLSSRLLALYPDHSTGCHRLWPEEELTLDIHYGDAFTVLQQLAATDTCSIDCWYADGFNPKTNPDLWHSELFAMLAECSRSGATLSTYSVAGAVRRALQGCGFTVEKSPGFGNKRHMLKARYARQTPCSMPIYDTRHITVLGAGLAGCSLAHSLARRGWRVTVLEAGAELLGGASGSGQLNLRCHLISEPSAMAGFYLHAFLFARQQFNTLTDSSRFWHPSALVQLDSALKVQSSTERQAYKKKLLALYETAVMSAQDATALSEVAGVTVKDQGLLFPLGGWVDPEGLLSAYLQHPNIKLLTGAAVARFDYRDSERLWQCYSASNTLISESPVLALCTGAGLLHWQQSQALGLQPVRGQNTFIHNPDLAERLKTVLCGTRTVFPVHNKLQTVSASYQRDNESMAPSPADDRENLALLGTDISAPSIEHSEISGARVALRYNSIDHAPIIGAMPDWQSSRENCRRQKPRLADLEQKMVFYPQLYVNSGHASTGLATCALAGDYLASLICAEPSPIAPNAMQQLSPARFLLRDLKKEFL